MQVIQTEINVQ